MSMIFLMLALVILISTSVSADEFHGDKSIPDIVVSFETATHREDGTPIQNLSGYELYHTIGNGTEQVFELGAGATEYILVDVGYGNHLLQIATIEDGSLGPRSKVIQLPISEPEAAKPLPPTMKVLVQVCVNGECESIQGGEK